MHAEFLQADVLGFTPLEYYFFNVEGNYDHYVDKVKKDGVMRPVFRGKIMNFQKIYDLSKREPNAGIYMSDLYLYILMTQKGLTARVYNLLDVQYQDINKPLESGTMKVDDKADNVVWISCG